MFALSLGVFFCAVVWISIRQGKTQSGRGRNFRRRSDPVNFWIYVIWFVLGALFALSVGAVGLIRAVSAAQ